MLHCLLLSSSCEPGKIHLNFPPFLTAFPEVLSWFPLSLSDSIIHLIPGVPLLFFALPLLSTPQSFRTALTTVSFGFNYISKTSSSASPFKYVRLFSPGLFFFLLHKLTIDHRPNYPLQVCFRWLHLQCSIVDLNLMPCVLTGVEPAFLCVDSDQASLHRGDEFSQSERRGRGRDEPNQCRARGRFTLFFAILSSSLLLRPGYIHCWLGFKPSYGPSLSTVLDVARVNPQQMPDLLWPAEGNNRRSSLPCGKEQSQVFFALPKGTIPGLLCPAERNNPRSSWPCRKEQSQVFFGLPKGTIPGAKTIKKNTNSTQNKFQTHRAKQYEVTSFLSTDCELSTETCSKNVYSLGPRSSLPCRKEQSHVFFGLPKGTIPRLLWPAERNNPRSSMACRKEQSQVFFGLPKGTIRLNTSLPKWHCPSTRSCYPSLHLLTSQLPPHLCSFANFFCSNVVE